MPIVDPEIWNEWLLPHLCDYSSRKAPSKINLHRSKESKELTPRGLYPGQTSSGRSLVSFTLVGGYGERGDTLSLYHIQFQSFFPSNTISIRSFPGEEISHNSWLLPQSFRVRIIAGRLTEWPREHIQPKVLWYPNSPSYLPHTGPICNDYREAGPETP